VSHRHHGLGPASAAMTESVRRHTPPRRDIAKRIRASVAPTRPWQSSFFAVAQSCRPMRAAPPTAQARSFLKLLAVNVQLFVSDLDGSGWRHGIDEFTQHAQKSGADRLCDSHSRSHRRHSRSRRSASLLRPHRGVAFAQRRSQLQPAASPVPLHFCVALNYGRCPRSSEHRRAYGED